MLRVFQTICPGCIPSRLPGVDADDFSALGYLPQWAHLAGTPTLQPDSASNDITHKTQLKASGKWLCQKIDLEYERQILRN
jgi:hypothetical protein